MMHLIDVLDAIVKAFYQLGAHHVTGTKLNSADGYVTTKHYLTVVCHIPSTFQHGTFRCSGWIRR